MQFWTDQIHYGFLFQLVTTSNLQKYFRNTFIINSFNLFCWIEVKTWQLSKSDFLVFSCFYVLMHIVNVRPSVYVLALFMCVCVCVQRPCASPLYNEIMRVSEAGEARAGHPTDRN